MRNVGYQPRNVALFMKESEDRSGTGSKLFLPSPPPSRIAIDSSSASIDHKWKLFPRQGFVGMEIPQFVAPTVAAPQPERRLDLVRKGGTSQ
ncbi:hypothetical protein ARMGADRAFT_453687 [Armillaria gallica]|uniref:Uncharacterized protein n=1 Tax=Armillaria gallica TaxID=47427 RepID=A0A2H3DHM4_ARMGA|nr:hypothetical protein ARMGADRAFT_453687 [Armillaria gallica]